MQIKSRIKQINKHTSLEGRQNIKYNTFNLKKYKNLFSQLSDDDLIVGEFMNSEWQFSCNTSNYCIPINFDLKKHTRFNSILKAYAIARTLSSIKALTIYNEIRLIKITVIESEGFKDITAFEKLLEQEIQNHSYQGHHLAITIKNFVSFYRVDQYEKIIDICDNASKRKKTNRKLPVFEDIITFDEVVNDYFRVFPSEETMKFLPIKLWWLLTNIVPMRPTEFLSLKKDCLEYHTDFISPYKIKIPRIKLKSKSYESDSFEESIEIDKKTYKLIKDIINNLHSVAPDKEDLFPVELLSEFHNKKLSKKNKRLNRRDFYDIKDSFYENVVEAKYHQFNLERIKAGDTRHFAIINLALQGFNMLSIARMAGHEEIRSQYSYYSHAEHFSQSYVYRMTQNHLENDINNRTDSGIIGWRRYILDKGLSSNIEEHNLEDIVGRVQYGYCTEDKTNFPNSCIEHCKFCPKFSFNPAINERNDALRWLSSSSEDLSNKIEETIKLMRDLSVGLTSSYNQSNDDILKTNSKQLANYMDKKAIIDANLIGDEVFERKK